MKKSLMLVLLIFTFGVTGFAADPSHAPGKNFDLSAFKLQTLDDNNAFVEITPARLAAGFTSPLFYTDAKDGSMVFAVPSDGQTTKGTHYPRTELRQVGNGADWKLTDTALHFLRVRCSVETVAHGKPQTIIGQIHGSQKEAELLKLRWTGDKPGQCFVEARYQRDSKGRDEYGVKLATGLSLGDIVSYTITMQNGKVTVTIGKESATQTYTKEFYGTSDSYYFKAGNYLQYNGKPVVTGVNKFYELVLQP